LLLVLNGVEEVVLGLVHRQSVSESLTRLGGGTVEQLVATSVVVFLVLVPFYAFRALGELLGERNLFRLFFVSREPAASETSWGPNLG
jgi:Na+/citrate or Na+/malate symporter